MMKFGIFMTTVAAALALAACSVRDGGNSAADSDAVNGISATNLIVGDEPPANAAGPAPAVESGMPVPGSNVVEKEVHRDPPAPDPHAGHDMGNMTNMQH